MSARGHRVRNRWRRRSSSPIRRLVHALSGAVREGVNLRLAALDRGLTTARREGLSGEPPAANRRPLPLGALRSHPPGGRFENNRAIRQYLLEQAGFAVVPFHAFGTRADNGWFRLSVGAVGVDEIAPAIDRVEAALAACLT